MSVVRSPVRSVVRSPVRGVFGGSASLADEATSYLNGIAPYHWFDFINDRCLYASNDVGGVSGATGYSFARASQGYYTNSDGTLTSFASGALRRGNRGVLIEGARTNLLQRSQEFDNASWVKEAGGSGVAASVTADQGVAPDGTTTAYRVQFSLAGATTSSDFSRLRQAATAAAGQTYSFWARSTDGVSTYNMTAGDADGVGAFQFTVTGTWQRFSRSTASGGGAVSYTLGLRGAQSPTNSNTADVLIWGAQLEAASFPSSYIPTTTASATRAADVLTCTAGVSYPLSLWAEFERAVDTGGGEALVLVDDGDSSDELLLFLNSSDLVAVQMTTGSASQGSVAVAGAVAVGAVTKAAGRGNTNSFISAKNGTLSAEDTSATLPATPTTLRFGARASASLPSFGYIRRAAIFNSALSDANLQSVTT